jgi:hypothetical protein
MKRRYAFSLSISYTLFVSLIRRLQEDLLQVMDQFKVCQPVIVMWQECCIRQKYSYSSHSSSLEWRTTFPSTCSLLPGPTTSSCLLLKPPGTGAKAVAWVCVCVCVCVDTWALYVSAWTYMQLLSLFKCIPVTSSIWSSKCEAYKHIHTHALAYIYKYTTCFNHRRTTRRRMRRCRFQRRLGNRCVRVCMHFEPGRSVVCWGWRLPWIAELKKVHTKLT